MYHAEAKIHPDKPNDILQILEDLCETFALQKQFGTLNQSILETLEFFTEEVQISLNLDHSNLTATFCSENEFYRFETILEDDVLQALIDDVKVKDKTLSFQYKIQMQDSITRDRQAVLEGQRVGKLEGQIFTNFFGDY